jgi:hypothetical protein
MELILSSFNFNTVYWNTVIHESFFGRKMALFDLSLIWQKGYYAMPTVMDYSILRIGVQFRRVKGCRVGFFTKKINKNTVQ